MTFNRRTRTMLLSPPHTQCGVIDQTEACTAEATEEKWSSNHKHLRLLNKRDGEVIDWWEARSPWRVSLAILRSENGKTAVPMSAKRFVKPPAPAYIRLLTLEDPFTVRQSTSLVVQRAPWIWRKQSSFALAGFVKISSLADVTPPSAANIEAESNVIACRDEDDKKKKKGSGRISISWNFTECFRRRP